MKKQKKKILIVGPAHPYRGGLASYNERLAKAFVEEGNDVEMQTFTIQYPNFLFPGKTQYTSSDAPLFVKIKRTLNSVNPINWLIVGLRIKNLKPDYLIVRYWLPFIGPSLGTICRIAKTNKHTKTLALIDNIIPHEKRVGDKQLSAYFVHSVDGFLVMSDDVEKDLQTFNTKDLPLVKNPHPLFDNFGEKVTKKEACAHLKLNEKTNYILFFGFIRNYKGLDLLLKAMADSFFENNNIKLLVAGEFYNNADDYHQIIKDNNLEDKVILHTNFIADNEVKYYFGIADIVALPYKSATQSGVTQIGYHFEKPMLVTNVGGLPEIIPDNKCGYVVEPNSEAINKSLQSFYKNNRKEEMIENVKEEKKKYDWSKLVDSFHTLANRIKK